MKHGVAIFPTDEGALPGELAALAEEFGFESIFFPDHTHIPASCDSPAPRGDELPREYSRLLDPFVALATAAAVTSRIRVATGVCLVVERDPIATAKAVATLDYLSCGRLLFGVGPGWNFEEMANHGTDPRRRYQVLAERMKAMKAIWTEHEASFAGEFVRFERIQSWPKPLQRPHPPILVGGNGPTVIERVLSFGDEWLPEPEDGLVERIADAQAQALALGRELPVTIYGALPEDVERYAQAGAHRCVYWLPAGDRTRTLRRLEELAAALPLRPPRPAAHEAGVT